MMSSRNYHSNLYIVDRLKMNHFWLMGSIVLEIKGIGIMNHFWLMGSIVLEIKGIGIMNYFWLMGPLF